MAAAVLMHIGPRVGILRRRWVRLGFGRRAFCRTSVALLLGLCKSYRESKDARTDYLELDFIVNFSQVRFWRQPHTCSIAIMPVLVSPGRAETFEKGDPAVKAQGCFDVGGAEVPDVGDVKFGVWRSLDGRPDLVDLGFDQIQPSLGATRDCYAGAIHHQGSPERFVRKCTFEGTGHETGRVFDY